MSSLSCRCFWLLPASSFLLIQNKHGRFVKVSYRCLRIENKAGACAVKEVRGHLHSDIIARLRTGCFSFQLWFDLFLTNMTSEYELLPSGRRVQMQKCKTNGHKLLFVLASVKLLNKV